MIYVIKMKLEWMEDNFCNGNLKETSISTDAN